MILLGCLAVGVACSREASDVPVPSREASGSSAPLASGPAAQELSTLLVQPAGYVAIANDPLSGPIDRSGVPYVFADKPGDARTILEHGFTAGYLQSWKTPDSANSSPTDSDNVMSIVLRFDTPENAQAILEYFRASNVADHYELFAVPEELSSGYGAYKAIPGGDAFLGVAWVSGDRLFNVTSSTSGSAASKQRLISLARDQNRR